MHRDKLIAGVRGADNLYRRRGRDVESRRQIGRLSDKISQAMVFRPREILCEASAHAGIVTRVTSFANLAT